MIHFRYLSTNGSSMMVKFLYRYTTTIVCHFALSLIHVLPPAYEASKRYFSEKYGTNLPVYILLSCGSMGGVRACNHFISLDTEDNLPTDCLLVVVLSVRYLSRSSYWNYTSYPSSFLDVVKSRVQLRRFPPTGTPVQYIARELRDIVHESGLYAPYLFLRKVIS